MNTGDPFYIDSDDVGQLIAILKDGLERSAGQDPTIGAIRRLADLKANVAEPWLRRALNHSNITVKTEAALALYKLGDFSAGLDALIALVSDDRSAVSAIRALAKTKDSKAVEALENLKSSSKGRSLMFNGDMTPLNTIIDRVLRDAMPKQFPPPASGDFHSSSQSKSGCFIATAAFGSPLSPEVLVFRGFRDDVLLPSKLGRVFVGLYYSASPLLSSFISRHRFVRRVTRRVLLQPILGLLKLRRGTRYGRSNDRNRKVR